MKSLVSQIVIICTIVFCTVSCENEANISKSKVDAVKSERTKTAISDSGYGREQLQVVENEVVKTIKVSYSDVTGIGEEKGVARRDPSDIIKVDDLYYVWYSKGLVKTGYLATVWYATSEDGINWIEQGQALSVGKPGSWEGESVFTPNIMKADGRYWLFYSGVSTKFGKGFVPDTKIGIAVSDLPEGPWKKLASNPVLANSADSTAFDSHLIDDACLIVRNGKYCLYYKGRQLGKSPSTTKMGVAIANSPEGPYVKYEGNPIIKGNHEVLVWPEGNGVAAMIGDVGPPEIVESILFSEDGLHFKKTYKVGNRGPDAGSAFRLNNFSDGPEAERIAWGLSHGSGGSLPFFQRFDIEWPKE